MTPAIIILPEKKLIGKRLVMSLLSDKTPELWRSFMPRKKEIPNSQGIEVYSLRVYPSTYDFSRMDLSATFEKWAAVQVSEYTVIPEGLERLTVSEGLYAVFQYKVSSTDPTIFRYIYGEWLPSSGYRVDNRPHFEVLGEKYKNADPESEEEIWLPIVK